MFVDKRRSSNSGCVRARDAYKQNQRHKRHKLGNARVFEGCVRVVWRKAQEPFAPYARRQKDAQLFDSPPKGFMVFSACRLRARAVYRSPCVLRRLRICRGRRRSYHARLRKSRCGTLRNNGPCRERVRTPHSRDDRFHATVYAHFTPDRWSRCVW